MTGWVEFHCPRHGFLVETTPNAVVRCACGKLAKPTRDGQVLKGASLARCRKSYAKALQNEGLKITKRLLPRKMGEDE